MHRDREWLLAEVERLRADLAVQRGCCDGAAAQDAHIRQEREEHRAEIERLRAEVEHGHRAHKIACEGGDLLRDEIKSLLAEVERLRTGLHRISLASQNSMSSKEECGRIAREALEGKP
jgi:uncharacterized small protein (DUF1192 family)